ncbi:hypothetical protein BCR42DRAFT_185910 [Absidia repens]|uniref:RING-type domain-containing protein n=1 Tax=Absidia repens TaxID=90262 RepID=A0A1X2HXE4_9FUNG|nr:hypothetical protein BCR42DRAFT_185910 [Absidia repens]
MAFLFGRHYVLLLCLLYCLFISLVTTQTLQNPAFGEELINFSGPNGDTRTTDPSDFRVAQAQAFQTVYLANNTSYKVKPLFDFKDACNQSTTLDDLQRWNHNGLNTLSGIQARTKIALVERGGNCTWSDKVRTVTQLSTSLRLSVNVMLIYDNQSYPTLPKYTLLPATGITTVPAYPSSQLPPQVNISLMDDNDISSSQLNTSSSDIVPNQPTEIYYISNELGLDLLSILQDCFDSTTPESNGAPSNYLFLVPVLRSFDWTKTVSSNKGTPNYLSWVIALAAFFLLAVFSLFIFFRWWRRRQRREDMEYNAMLEERNLIAMQRRKLKPLPVDIVNSYPIQNYHADVIKNATCAICLDEFEENQPDIRVLPCSHGFCVLCIGKSMVDSKIHSLSYL